MRETNIGAPDQPKVRSCDSFASLPFDQAQPDRRRWMLRHHLHLCDPSGSIFRRCQVEPPNFCHGQVRKPLACQLLDSSSCSIRRSTQAAANGAFHVDARPWRSCFHLRDHLDEHKKGGQQPYQSCDVKTRLLELVRVFLSFTRPSHSLTIGAALPLTADEKSATTGSSTRRTTPARPTLPQLCFPSSTYFLLPTSFVNSFPQSALFLHHRPTSFPKAQFALSDHASPLPPTHLLLSGRWPSEQTGTPTETERREGHLPPPRRRETLWSSRRRF